MNAQTTTTPLEQAVVENYLNSLPERQRAAVIALSACRTLHRAITHKTTVSEEALSELMAMIFSAISPTPEDFLTTVAQYDHLQHLISSLERCYSVPGPETPQ